MKYDHIVKVGGVYYKAKQEVPEDNMRSGEPGKGSFFNGENIGLGEKPYTKTGIIQMRKEDLVRLAQKHGIENPSEISVGELKRRLIELLKL